jgi:HEAT repeat protein
MSLSEPLRRTLESACGHAIEEVITNKTDSALRELQSLLSMEEDVDPSLRQHAIHILGRWGALEAVPGIVRLLPHLDERGRINAISALGQIGTPEALAAVSERANDPDPDVRRFVVHALGRIGGDEAKAKLEELSTRDPVDFVRQSAARTLRMPTENQSN